jgi:F-type H+-transporting ATPase subunit gamma
VFTSDQGLAGAYNSRIVQRAVRHARSGAGEVDVFVVGRRGHDLLRMRGVEAVAAESAPTSLEGIHNRVGQLASRIYGLYAERNCRHMDFLFNRYEGRGSFEETVLAVLPPDRQRLHAAAPHQRACEPILTDTPMNMLGRLAEEYFFVELYRALLESHASENGARLASMTAAASNIEDRVDHLTQDYRSARQQQITAELLDVVGGAEALREMPEDPA